MAGSVPDAPGQKYFVELVQRFYVGNRGQKVPFYVPHQVFHLPFFVTSPGGAEDQFKQVMAAQGDETALFMTGPALQYKTNLETIYSGWGIFSAINGEFLSRPLSSIFLKLELLWTGDPLPYSATSGHLFHSCQNDKPDHPPIPKSSQRHILK